MIAFLRARPLTPHTRWLLVASALLVSAGGVLLLLTGSGWGAWVMLSGAGVVPYLLARCYWPRLIGAVGEGGGEAAAGRWRLPLALQRPEPGLMRVEALILAAFSAVLVFLRNRTGTPAGEGSLGGSGVWPGYISAWSGGSLSGGPLDPMAPWGLPALNTALLLGSAASLTWAVRGLQKQAHGRPFTGLLLTFALAAGFLFVQALQYLFALVELGPTLDAGAYGGAWLAVSLTHLLYAGIGLALFGAALLRHFTRHDAREGGRLLVISAWQWSLVVGSWLALYLFVYWS